MLAQRAPCLGNGKDTGHTEHLPEPHVDMHTQAQQRRATQCWCNTWPVLTLPPGSVCQWLLVASPPLLPPLLLRVCTPGRGCSGCAGFCTWSGSLLGPPALPVEPDLRADLRTGTLPLCRLLLLLLGPGPALLLPPWSLKPHASACWMDHSHEGSSDSLCCRSAPSPACSLPCSDGNPDSSLPVLLPTPAWLLPAPPCPTPAKRAARPRVPAAACLGLAGVMLPGGP